MIIQIIKNILKPIRAFVLRAYYTRQVNKTKPPYILCECYMITKNGKVKVNNWGDDLNSFLFEYATGLKVINIPFSKMFNKGFSNVYSLIGSILNFYSLDKKVVYGTGIMNPKGPVRGMPEQIISVRGPKTREVLLERGISCPEKYGDPVLLLPCLYKVKGQKHNKPVIIPNMGTFDEDITLIEKLAEKLDAKILDLRNYNKWTDPIDEICGASFVISESLHGLIVAETYNIPSVWVDFISHPDYWNFKYEDFYGSIGKKESIIEIRKVEDVDAALEKVRKWEKGNIDYQELKNLFPFEAEWVE